MAALVSVVDKGTHMNVVPKEDSMAIEFTKDGISMEIVVRKRAKT